MRHLLRSLAFGLLAFSCTFPGLAQLPEKSILASGWQLQDSGKVPQSGEALSKAQFVPKGWHRAVVPGTVLTSLVANKVYPEPLYGENNRTIPERLCRTDWWYRTSFPVPATYEGKKIWLNFDGINYAAEVWVNGKNVGSIKGAFIRGLFDVTAVVQPGKTAAVAVRVSPQPNPGIPYEHYLGGTEPNGGIASQDGPTFLCSMGWDWMPGIRDRNTGIWQKVYLSTTGNVVLKDPFVSTDLPLPRIDSADVTIQSTLQNVSGQPRKVVLKGSFEGVTFEKEVDLPAGATQMIAFEPNAFPQLRLANPRLWWPNGFGQPNLYKLHLSVEADGNVLDARDLSFGVREITYDEPTGKYLTVNVNGVRVPCKGGNWGMDEAMKRIPRERLEAQIRMHQQANYTMIRNWVGQSTSDEFYSLCDQYGMLLWDEFFLANPHDTPNPTDLATYMANVRDKVLRYRNHPSIAIWCARNEGNPPKAIDEALVKLLAELDPVRHYQASSTDGGGVRSHGPYSWRKPAEYYKFPEELEAFKTEIGSMSIPTLESIQGMIPKKDWNTINDAWAQRDFISSDGMDYPRLTAGRYGKLANLADFARKGQMMNYEAYRAMYEGRLAKLFNPVQGVLIWMSSPAQPSFVWQLYHHDLEPSAALFAVQKACEQIHIQLNEGNESIQVINTLPKTLTGARARITLYNLDGASPFQQEYEVNAAPSTATSLGTVTWPAGLSSLYFVKLQLHDAAGKLLSDNFYWRSSDPKQEDLTALDSLPVATLETKTVRRDVDGKVFLDVSLRNPGTQVAVMTHLQLRRGSSRERVLPVYYSDNYVSLAPNEEKTITIEAALADLKGETPLVLLDGWNVAVKPESSKSFAVALNDAAQVSHWPKTGLPFGKTKEKLVDAVRINCGGGSLPGGWKEDHGLGGASVHAITVPVDRNVPNAAPEAVYRTERVGVPRFLASLKPLPPGQAYTVRLHFVETTHSAPGQRLFIVWFNGKPVLTDFDIFQEAGGQNKVLVKEFRGVLPEKNNRLEIAFRKGKADQPQVCGIEIFKENQPQ